jgi:hypothetical protein
MPNGQFQRFPVETFSDGKKTTTAWRMLFDLLVQGLTSENGVLGRT